MALIPWMLLWGGLWYYPDCEKITLLVPFRADNPYRAKVWQWLIRYWEHELPEAELIVCTDDRRPFCKTTALNRGFEKAKGDIIVLLDADCYIRGQVIRDCAGKIRSSRRRDIPLWYVPYRRFYRNTTDFRRSWCAGALWFLCSVSVFESVFVVAAVVCGHSYGPRVAAGVARGSTVRGPAQRGGSSFLTAGAWPWLTRRWARTR